MATPLLILLDRGNTLGGNQGEINMTTLFDLTSKQHKNDFQNESAEKRLKEKKSNTVGYYNVRHVTYFNEEEYILYSAPVVTGVNSKVKKAEYFVGSDGKEYNAETGLKRSDESIKASINSSLKRTHNKVYGYALANDWSGGWFLTITFDSKQVERFDYTDCYKRMYQFLKNVKEQNPDFMYLFVPQVHKKKGWHFHGVVAKCDKLKFENSGIVKNDMEIYNVNKNSFKYGFTTASQIVNTNKVIHYFANRITEDLIIMSKEKHRYICSRNLVKPKSETLFAEDLDSMKLFLSESEEYVGSHTVPDRVSGGEITYIKFKRDM